MTWAFFSDVHGNVEALDEVIQDFQRVGVTRAIFLGDVVGYGASPNECLKRVASLVEYALLGNHDMAALTDSPAHEFNEVAQQAVLWTRSVLSQESRKWLLSFPLTEVVDDIRIVHASPVNPERWEYILDPYTAEFAFPHFEEALCFVGHTHVPMIFEKPTDEPCQVREATQWQLQDDSRYIINVGSVGQPRDGDPRASYVLYDPETRTVTYQRVAYDIHAAQQKIEAAGLPEFLSHRLELGR